MGATRTIISGSRSSRLARWQTGYILDHLQSAWPEQSFKMVTLSTEGDRISEKPLPEIGGKGVFTAELEQALICGEIDLAVHSLKDLPTNPSPGLVIGAIPARGDAREVLVSANGEKLGNLIPGSRIGTSSLRREAQIRALRPDLAILPLRGNVDTRVRKALEGQYDAIVLAAAGVERLDLTSAISEYLPFEIMLPAPGQGALAVQCRADDAELVHLLRALHDEVTARAVTAERVFLAALESGCSAPVAAYASEKAGIVEIHGLVATTDGKTVIRVYAEGKEPSVLGKELAQMAIHQGAGELLR
jgi:hydroxymethylbilane synthase